MGSLALTHDDGPRCRGALDALDVSSLSLDDLTPNKEPDHVLAWSFFGAREPTTRASSTAPEKPPELLSLELDTTRTLDSPTSTSCTQTTSLGIDFDHFSFQLPLFTNSGPTDVTRVDLGADIDKNCQTARTDNHLEHLFYTFFQSPSTSTTSLVFDASSPSTSDITSCLSQEPKPAMPGPILAAPVGAEFPDIPLRDYFTAPSTDEATEQRTTDGNQTRPRSRSLERKSRRSASPIFTLWARRHQHQQHDRSNRSSSESKSNGGSNHGFIHKRAALSRSGSIQKRQSQAGAVPQMTREEFEALPLAIQRKYFSTLERLRFAQDSGRVDGISQHYDDISNFRRRKARQDRSVSEQIVGRVRQQSGFESHLLCSDSLPSYASLPDKIKRKEFTREEQVILARRLRASVILDAADEAICKLNRRASKNLDLSRKTYDTPLSSPTESMESQESQDDTQRSSSNHSASKEIPQSFYDSFRWLDEEEDLDLRLFLDDYHSNLRDNLPSPTKQQRPSFRRHLSISKIPFGRNSVSLSRPGTKDASTPISPSHSPSGSASNPFGQPRRKSRALSLIAPRHAQHDSLSGFDPAATHYQDPEARLKLRVYLASPQKFDEAIEFGFPSADVLSAAPGKENDPHHRRQSSANMRTFLADDDDDDEDDDENDRASLNSDNASMTDPDSPKTPHAFDSKPGNRAVRPLRLVSTEPALFGEGGGAGTESGGYAQAPASSREMTLRMTLTRPDLRANEDQLYGWQQAQGLQPGRKSTTLGYSGFDGGPTYVGDGPGKESMDGRSIGFDHWGPAPTDKGVMKRIWNRVRRS
ncbi:hypothetical protein QBC37DRAFT_178186 [Rhypophila decipiens]|uniref:Mucin n=1 Tax=Rhypophila decipiens TaxID=261697 RepID=A0AAN6YHH9_9PEZI|nr:hypothetical protein QBC37DRAFT_178186 [Rhypophila decipiens]